MMLWSHVPSPLDPVSRFHHTSWTHRHKDCRSCKFDWFFLRYKLQLWPKSCVCEWHVVTLKLIQRLSTMLYISVNCDLRAVLWSAWWSIVLKPLSIRRIGIQTSPTWAGSIIFHPTSIEGQAFFLSLGELDQSFFLSMSSTRWVLAAESSRLDGGSRGALRTHRDWHCNPEALGARDAGRVISGGPAAAPARSESHASPSRAQCSGDRVRTKPAAHV